jgi:hypothetical protein
VRQPAFCSVRASWAVVGEAAAQRAAASTDRNRTRDHELHLGEVRLQFIAETHARFPQIAIPG